MFHLFMHMQHFANKTLFGAIWGITLRKIMIEKYWSFALLIICHFFLLLSTWGPGCQPRWCHQSNQHLCAFRSHLISLHENDSQCFDRNLLTCLLNECERTDQKSWKTIIQKAPQHRQLIVSSWSPIRADISQRQASDINRCFFPQLKPRVKLQRSRNEFAKRLDVVIQNDSNNSKQFITQCHHRFNQKQRSERIHEALEAVEL